MASVSGVTGSGSNSSSSLSATGVQATEDRFLKLLVTQMKNQDPLNPLDNAQVTSQMAQLSTVSGIEKLNATLQSFTKSQAFQAVGMIGHQVLADGSSVGLKGGAGAAGFELSGAADSVKVAIYDANGALVRSMDLGKQNQGVSVFQWDGKTDAGTVAPDGGYTFTVKAAQGSVKVDAQALAFGAVQSVLMDSVGPALSVAGMGQVDLSQVRQII